MDDVKEDEIDQPKEEEESSWWSSWPNWLQAAKEKSSTAYEFMKRDLTEFSQVVQTDAVAAVSSTAALLKEKLMVDDNESVAGKARQSFTSMLGTIADAFVPQKEIEDTEIMIIKNSEPVVLDWWQAQLYTIRKDPKTYCHEPEGPPEMYENWLETFDLEEYEEEMTKMMFRCSEVQSLYDNLVPSAVSHLEFWQRYFYRVHLLKKAEAKRAELIKRAEEMSIDDMKWDEEETQKGHENVISSTNSDLLKEQCDLPITSITSDKCSPMDSIVKDLDMGSVLLKTSCTKSDIQISDLSSQESNTFTTTVSSAPNCDKGVTDDNYKLNTDEDRCVKKTILKENLGNELTSEICVEITNTCEQQKNNSTEGITDENRSSPSDSASKDYSTGDEWEKDFDIEVTENDLKQAEQNLQQLITVKEGEEDWENWE